MSQKSEPVPSIHSHVSDLALQLHEERQLKLRVNLAPGQVLEENDFPTGCKLIDGAIEFESLEVRNTIIAAAAYKRLSATSEIDTNALFQHAFELWRKENGRSDKASGRLLALAAESMDVFAIGAQRIRSGSDVFDVLHLIEAALPYLEKIPASSIIDLLAAKYEPTKNDMVAGRINRFLEEWLEKRPEVARELHTKVLENLSEETSSLLGNAIIALSKSDYAAGVEMARADTRSDMLMQAQVGTWTLGRLLLDEHAQPEAINVVVESVLSLIESEQPEIRSQAIRAAVGAMHKTSEFDSLLERLAEDDDQDVLCAAATALFQKSKEIRERGITQRWLQLLTTLKPEFTGAVRELDYAMSQLLSEPGHTEMVASMLGQWAANHGSLASTDSNIAELFDDTIRELSGFEESWSLLITDWLLSDEQTHAAALAEILSQFNDHSATDIKLNKNRLNELSPEDLLFLARRMLGYVHDRAQLTSLALSMLQSNAPEKRIYPVLWSLLVEEIGYDYPGSTVDALHKAAEEILPAGHRDFLRAAADSISQITETQRALPSINELRPPTRLRRLFSRAREKQMNNSLEEARKHSPLRQIVTQIPLKAGAGTFNYHHSSYGPSTKLSTVSHSIELPRREAFDPIGNSMRHFELMLAKRGEP